MKRSMSSVALLGLFAGSSSTARAYEASARAYEEATVADGGTLRGTVRFAGALPKLDPVPVTRHRDVCGEQKTSEALVIGPDRGVKGAVVKIEGVTRGKKTGGDLVLDNAGCALVPHVSAVMAGTRARVRSSDPVVHHTVGVAGAATVFNLALPSKGQEVDITRRLATPGVVRVGCEVHPHMSAWLVIHDSPYVATTDERGAFRIDGIPPGTYTVTLWHEGFRAKRADAAGRPRHDEPATTRRQVTIAPRAEATIAFEMK
jgi:hypothetical protein